MTRVIAISTVFIAALAVLAGAARPATAAQDTPCVELRLKGGYEMAIPCPEGLDEILSLFQPRQRAGGDRRPVIEPDWPHDGAMVRKPPASDDDRIERILED